MSTVAGQGKGCLMETEPMLFKALWLILFPGLHGGEYIMLLEARSLCTYLLFFELIALKYPTDHKYPEINCTWGMLKYSNFF